MNNLLDRNRDHLKMSRLFRTTRARAVQEADPSRAPLDPRIRFGTGGGVYRIVTTSEESGGSLFGFEATEPPGGGPPLHTHATEDEFFFVLEGEINVYIDGQVVVAKAGQTAFVPRGLPHCFKNVSTRKARVLVLFNSGNIEGFFDYGLPVNGKQPSEEHLLNRLIELGPKFGLEFLGPSPL